jgi:2-dehydro-3-deoxygluconokinase
MNFRYAESTRREAFDVATVGEAMLRLTAPTGMRLAAAPALDVHVAGAEANVAAGLAQLGVGVRWASRLPASPLGRRVDRELASLGVITDAVEWGGEDERLGLFFAEAGSGARPSAVWYDRGRSAFTAMERLPAGFADGARIVHLTGITPALGPGPAAVAAEAARADALVSLDVNYRARLWAADEARRGVEPLLARADIVFCAERDARTVFGLDGAADELLTGIAALTPRPRLAVVTRGPDPVLALDDDGHRYQQAPPAVPIVDRFGMGDALIAGVLWGLLHDDVKLGLRAGVELAALKGSLQGDLLRLEPGELQRRLATTDERPEVIR